MGALAVFVVVLAGCASPPGSEEPTQLEPSSVACPQVEGVELPPECVPYDPEAFMDANLAYKDHMPVDELSFAGFEAKRADITAAIVALRDSGDLTVDSLAATVNTAGPGPEHLAVIRAWDDAGTLRFDAYGPTGGCVEGSVTNTEVEMAILGPINDGGCVPAVGH